MFSFICSPPPTCLLLCAPAPASPPGTSRKTGQMSLITRKSPSTQTTTQTSAFSRGFYLDSDKKMAGIRSDHLPSVQGLGALMPCSLLSFRSSASLRGPSYDGSLKDNLLGPKAVQVSLLLLFLIPFTSLHTSCQD